jgi:phosphohistidine phosphatase
MKKLLLIRHAKAGSHDMDDFKRPLTDKGIHDAGIMAAEMKKAKLVPEYILASSSVRTRMTADIIAKSLSVTNIGTDKSIYEASTHTLLKAINHLPDEFQFAALVGHNPGISQLIYELTGELRDMPPGGIALISFDVDEWETVHFDTGKLGWHDSPKMH